MTDTPPAAAEHGTKPLDDIMAGMLAASMFMCASIIGVLKQKGLLDPDEVAGLADYFASNNNSKVPPLADAAMQERLREFATLIRAMNTMPAGTGHA